MAVSPLTVDKTNHKHITGLSVILGRGDASARHNRRGWLLVAMNLITLSCSDTLTPQSNSFRGNALKFDFELEVKAKAVALEIK